MTTTDLFHLLESTILRVLFVLFTTPWRCSASVRISNFRIKSPEFSCSRRSHSNSSPGIVWDVIFFGFFSIITSPRPDALPVAIPRFQYEAGSPLKSSWTEKEQKSVPMY